MILPASSLPPSRLPPSSSHSRPKPAQPSPPTSTWARQSSTTRSPALILAPPTGAPLYIVGFRIRAGWRFDVGPVFLLPELGGGYDVEHFASGTTVSVPLGVPRVFAGGRAGFSIPLAPALRFEPAIYGHLGDAWYVERARTASRRTSASRSTCASWGASSSGPRWATMS